MEAHVWGFTVLKGTVLSWKRSSPEVESLLGLEMPTGEQFEISGGHLVEDQCDLADIIKDSRMVRDVPYIIYHEASLPENRLKTREDHVLKIKIVGDTIELIGDTFPDAPAPTAEPTPEPPPAQEAPPEPPQPRAILPPLPPKPEPAATPPVHAPASAPTLPADQGHILEQLRIIAGQGTEQATVLKQLTANTGTMCGHMAAQTKELGKFDLHLAGHVNQLSKSNEHMELVGKCLTALTEDAASRRWPRRKTEPETEEPEGDEPEDNTSGGEKPKKNTEKKKATQPVPVRKNYWPVAVAAVLLALLGWVLYQRQIGTPFGMTDVAKEESRESQLARDTNARELESLRRAARDKEPSSGVMLLTNGQVLLLATNATRGQQFVNCTFTNVSFDNSVKITERPTTVIPVPQYAPVSVPSASCTHTWSGHDQPGQQAEKYVTPVERVTYVNVSGGGQGGGYIAGSIGSVGLGLNTCLYPSSGCYGGMYGGGWSGGRYCQPRNGNGNALVFNLDKRTYNNVGNTTGSLGGGSGNRPPPPQRPPTICRPAGHR